MNVLQQVVDGIIIGHAYALVAVGWTMLSLMIATLGFGQMLEGAAGLAFGPKPQTLASPFQDMSLHFGAIWFTVQDAILIVATIIVFLALRYVLNATRFGTSVRMVAEDPPLTRLGGIDITRVYIGIFAFEGAAVAFAATLVAPRTPILTSMGFDQVVMTFVVVVLGGIGSVVGSYVAGVSVGLFTALFGALVSPAYTTAAVFALLIAVMVLRPGQLAASANFAR